MTAATPDGIPQGPSKSREIVLDVRGMEPPEPMERVLEAIDAFVAGDKLKLVIDCRPLPLYRILGRNGFAFREKPGTESLYEIEIWRES
jgi:uncharacterized protein (DUF2249 family)